MIRVNEGKETNDLCSLLGNKDSYISLLSGKSSLICVRETCLLLSISYPLLSFSLILFSTFHWSVLLCCAETKKFENTPRLFELSSTIGEFTAQEVLFPARNDEVEAFPYDQNDLYSVPQPGMLLTMKITQDHKYKTHNGILKQ